VKVNVINDYTLFYDFGVDLKQTHVQHTTRLYTDVCISHLPSSSSISWYRYQYRSRPKV